MQNATAWQWKVIGNSAIAAGEVNAVDARDAVSRALTTTCPAAPGQLIGEFFHVPLSVLDGAPGNFDKFYESSRGHVYVSVRATGQPESRTVEELHALWGVLSDVPVADDDTIEIPYLHFEAGTPREDIWHWFEDQHPHFVVGEVANGTWRQ
jgi:hypothetical protein